MLLPWCWHPRIRAPIGSGVAAAWIGEEGATLPGEDQAVRWREGRCSSSWAVEGEGGVSRPRQWMEAAVSVLGSGAVAVLIGEEGAERLRVSGAERGGGVDRGRRRPGKIRRCGGGRGRRSASWAVDGGGGVRPGRWTEAATFVLGSGRRRQRPSWAVRVAAASIREEGP